MLLYLEDHSYREIAEMLGISETNVATKINRLKQRIRKDVCSSRGHLDEIARFEDER
jgi:DNA-directed RNA polymerase specialized sigma24 family protein